MKRIIMGWLLLVAGVAQAGTIETFQIGGVNTVNRNIKWGEGTFSGSTGIHTWASTVDPNLVFTVTSTINNGDLPPADRSGCLGVNSGARQDDLAADRISGDESVTITVSYVDPTGSLKKLNLIGISPQYGQNKSEITVFTDGRGKSESYKAYANDGSVIHYPSTSLDALTKDNTGTWSLTISAGSAKSQIGMGAFRLEYEVNTEPATLGLIL